MKAQILPCNYLKNDSRRHVEKILDKKYLLNYMIDYFDVISEIHISQLCFHY